MPVDIATTLMVRDHRSDGPASLVDIACVCGRWAKHENPEALVEPGMWEGVGRRGATLTTQKWDLGADEAWAWQMRLHHPDDDDPSVLWVVEVSAIEDPSRPDTEVAVTVGRESRDRRVRQLRTDRPAPPRLFRELLEAPGLECLDGGIPMSASPRKLGRDSVPEFAREVLLAAERRLPVVGVSLPPTSGTPVVEPEPLARRLAGMAHVWIVPPEATWALSAELPDRLGVYNGAVRLWWPGLDAGSQPRDHRLWQRDADDVLRDISGVVMRSARARFRPPEALERIRQELDERTRERKEQELDELRALLDESTSPESTRAAAEIARLQQTIAGQQTEIDDLVGEFEALEEERDRLRDDVGQLRWENRSLKGRLNRAGLPDEPASGADEPESAFVDEVHAAYEGRYTGHDREEWPIGSIQLHPDFLGAVDQLGFDRQKLLEVCADVACGRARKIGARKVHGLRQSIAGNAPQRVRSKDGAKAWRCALEVGTPSARRLHWWSLPGGGVELAHVGVHDDEQIPE